jgi:hypothetical protein
VEWDSVVAGISPGGNVLGYKLYVRDANVAETTLVFDGFSLGFTDQTYFTVYGLKAGTDYMFSVLAVNYNYDCTLSDEVLLYSCTPPSAGLAPVRVTSDTTSMTVAWTTPNSDGGCQILGYAVYIDDGAQGAFVEVNSVNDPLVRNDPGIH